MGDNTCQRRTYSKHRNSQLRKPYSVWWHCKHVAPQVTFRAKQIDRRPEQDEVIHSFIHSFIHSGYYYSPSSSPLLLRGAPDTAQILCRSFTPKRHRQLRAKEGLKLS